MSLDLVERFIETAVCGNDGAAQSKINKITLEHFSTGGKRLRARIALEVAALLGVEQNNAVYWASACEILHNATLVHDDIQDGDTLRRGQPTVWYKYGKAEAINVGDLLLLLPVKVLENLKVDPEIRWNLARSLATAAENVVRGQSLEFSLKDHLGSEGLPELYKICVNKKTSALFELPVFGALILGGLNLQKALEASKVFEDFGRLFQIQDDLLDLWGKKGRDEVGSDIKEGKVSALVVEHLRLVPNDLEWLQTVLLAPRSETSTRDVQETIFRFEKSGAKATALKTVAGIKDSILKNPALVENIKLRPLVEKLLSLVLDPISHLYEN